MGNMVLMAKADRLDNLAEVQLSLVLRDGTVTLNVIVQVATFSKLEDEVQPASCIHHLVQSYHMRMPKQLHDSNLVLEVV